MMGLIRVCGELCLSTCFLFCKQKTASEMLIRDWGSDVCSSDLTGGKRDRQRGVERHAEPHRRPRDRQEQRLLAQPLVQGGALLHAPPVMVSKIGRASCRERVCLYV